VFVEVVTRAVVDDEKDLATGSAHQQLEEFPERLPVEDGANLNRKRGLSSNEIAPKTWAVFLIPKVSTRGWTPTLAQV
jgi:hypothetical protein